MGPRIEPCGTPHSVGAVQDMKNPLIEAFDQDGVISGVKSGS